LILAATIFLVITLFSNKNEIEIGFMEALTIYSGVTFAALISASSDYVKEK
jgi:hypothetical protein